jgi:hypothetical protein
MVFVMGGKALNVNNEKSLFDFLIGKAGKVDGGI